jgi:hypothetical protein
MCIARIIVSSPTLRQASLEYRANSIDIVLAKRIGASLDDRRVKLMSAVWGSIMMTALTNLGDEALDWTQLSIDDVIDQLEATYAEFAGEIGALRRPV